MSGFDRSEFEKDLEAATRAKDEPKTFRKRVVKKAEEIWCKFSGKK